MDGWVDGLMEVKAGLRIAYSNQQDLGRWMEGWVDGWMGGFVDGWMEAKAGLRIAYNNQK